MGGSPPMGGSSGVTAAPAPTPPVASVSAVVPRAGVDGTAPATAAAWATPSPRAALESADLEKFARLMYEALGAHVECWRARWRTSGDAAKIREDELRAALEP